VTEHTAQMQGVEVSRIVRQNGVVDFSGLFEMALLVQSQRQLDGKRSMRALLAACFAIPASLGAAFEVYQARSAKMVNQR